MTNFGYMFFTFRAHRHGQGGVPLVLGQLYEVPQGAVVSRSQTDAVVTLYGLLNGMVGHRIDERHKHLGIASVKPTGRTINFTLELGTSGQNSTFVDPKAGKTVFKREGRHIETGQRRGLFVVPTTSTVGLLALESQSRSTGREQLTAALKRGFRTHTGLILDFDAVVHEEALSAFLAQAKVNAITLRRSGLPHDIAEQLEVRQPDEHLGRMELTISRGRIGEFKQQLADKFRRDKEARTQLLSAGNLDFDEVNVKLQLGERNTTLLVSADKMPTFVYHLSSRERPTDQRFYDEVIAMVPEVAQAFGAIVGGGWQTGEWSEEALTTEIQVPAQEVPDDGGQTEAP